MKTHIRPSKARASQVWKSLGITYSLFHFMTVVEWNQLQELCRFFYEAAVGRIQTRFKVAHTVQLVLQNYRKTSY